MWIASPADIAAAWKSGLRRFSDDSGGTLIEYALILAIVTIVGAAALNAFAHNASQTLSTAAGSLGS